MAANPKPTGASKSRSWDKLPKPTWAERCVANEHRMKFVKVRTSRGLCDPTPGLTGARNACGKCFGLGQMKNTSVGLYYLRPSWMILSEDIYTAGKTNERARPSLVFSVLYPPTWASALYCSVCIPLAYTFFNRWSLYLFQIISTHPYWVLCIHQNTIESFSVLLLEKIVI